MTEETEFMETEGDYDPGNAEYGDYDNPEEYEGEFIFEPEGGGGEAEEDYWNTGEAQEGEQELTGYGEEEGEAGEPASAEDGEFSEFENRDAAFGQLGFKEATTQMSFGDVGFGTSAGKEYEKLEKAVRAQSVTKEQFYLHRLKGALSGAFENHSAINLYADIVSKVPRFWLKNINLMVATLSMINRLHGADISTSALSKSSKEHTQAMEDLYRYFKLLKPYM